MPLPGKHEQKLKAQEMLMHGIAVVLGYWSENQPNPFDLATMKPLAPEDEAAFQAILLREADRVAKLFGYDEAWSA